MASSRYKQLAACPAFVQRPHAGMALSHWSFLRRQSQHDRTLRRRFLSLPPAVSGECGRTDALESGKKGSRGILQFSIGLVLKSHRSRRKGRSDQCDLLSDLMISDSCLEQKSHNIMQDPFVKRHVTFFLLGWLICGSSN